MENGFNSGDLAWARIRRCPWWPCIIYHEALSSTEVQKSKRQGCMLVSFYGDNTYQWLDPKNLVPFESNFNLYSNPPLNSKQSCSRSFLEAVSEAVDEVKNRAAVGLSCPCNYFTHYKRAPVKDLVNIDIDGHKLGGVFTVKQIEDFRQEFKPVEMLSFIQQLALDSRDVLQDLKHKKEVARFLVFRKANYAEIDEPYFQAFGVDPKRLGDPIVASDDQEACLNQDPFEQSKGQKKPKVKHQNKVKKSPALQKDKLRATKTKRLEKKKLDCNTKSSENHVPKKKTKRSKGEVDKKLDLSSPITIIKENPPPKGEVEKELNFSSLTTIVKRQRSSNGEVEKKLDFSSSTRFVKGQPPPLSKGEVEKMRDFSSSTTFVKERASFFGSKHDSPPTPKLLKKRHRSRNTMPLALSPQNKRKKGENSATVKKHQVEPRMVISMEFPSGTILPSVSELKAKFARFGPLDTSGICISWAKSRCRLVFINKSDAEEAYAYAVSKKLFGQTKVNYWLLPEISASDFNLGHNQAQEEAPVNQIVRRYQEIYAKYREEADRTHVLAGQRCIDISEKKLFGQTKVNYRLLPEISTSDFSLGHNQTQEEAPVNQIVHRYQEIYVKYRDEADRTHVQVGHRGIDISEKMLYLLNECKRVVLGSK